MGGDKAGANHEIFSYHPGGANVLLVGSSVTFQNDTTVAVVIRSLVSLSDGEVVSADVY